VHTMAKPKNGGKPECSSIKRSLRSLLLDGPDKERNKDRFDKYAIDMHRVHQDASTFVKILHSLIGRYGWLRVFEGGMIDNNGILLDNFKDDPTFFKFFLDPYFYTLVCVSVVPPNPLVSVKKSKFFKLSERLRYLWENFDTGISFDQDDDDSDQDDDNIDQQGDDDSDQGDDGGGDGGGGKGDSKPLDFVYTRLKRENGSFSTNQHLVQLGKEMATAQATLIRTRYSKELFAEFVNTAYNKRKFEAKIKANQNLSTAERKDAIQKGRAKTAAMKKALVSYVDPAKPPPAFSGLFDAADISFLNKWRPMIVPPDADWVKGEHGYHLIYTAVKRPELVYPVIISSSSSPFFPFFPSFPQIPSFPFSPSFPFFPLSFLLVPPFPSFLPFLPFHLSSFYSLLSPLISFTF
jgi:hypothetical protein